MVLVVVVALIIWQLLAGGRGFEQSFRKALFNGVSIITGTGYASENYSAWGSFPTAVFFLIGLIGGCAVLPAARSRYSAFSLCLRPCARTLPA